MKKLLIVMLALALLSPTVSAKEKKASDKPKQEQTKQDTKKKAKKKGKKGQQPDAPEQKPAPKPSVERKGMFNVSKLENDWIFEIPDSLIGRDFLTTTRYTSTPAGSGKFGGEMVNQQTVYFQPGVDNQLLLRVRLLVNVSDTTQNINKAITVSNENPIIASFKIESHKDSLYKIKVNAFLNDDNPTTGLTKSTKTNYQITNVLGNLSYIEDIKTFPMNTEVRMVKTYNSNSSSLASVRSTGKATFGLNLSFVLLPEKPRKKPSISI